jgi:CPA2 family monovalent cation:H+ antiporter-2
VSFALGAFFAGMVVNGSDLSHEAAADSLPLQDAFSVLFFVAVGMLFGPAILVRQPIQVLAVVAIVMFGKSLGAFAIVLAFGYPIHTAALISASLAQVGEFSFILAALGVSLGLMAPEGQSLIVAGAILSISLNPLAFGAAARGARWIAARPSLLAKLERNVRPHAPAPEEPTPSRRPTTRSSLASGGSAASSAASWRSTPSRSSWSSRSARRPTCCESAGCRSSPAMPARPACSSRRTWGRHGCS